MNYSTLFGMEVCPYYVHRFLKGIYAMASTSLANNFTKKVGGRGESLLRSVGERTLIDTSVSYLVWEPGWSKVLLAQGIQLVGTA